MTDPQQITRHVSRDRLLDTATRLIAISSPTGEAGAVLEALAQILAEDGFAVDRPDGGHASAPAVVVRFSAKEPGPTLQFNGHIDTVHLPFVPPAIEGDLLTGSGASDMKGGLSAAVEALRALRDADALEAGSVLLVAHDLHEAPWGFGQQLDRLIEGGTVGDAVLIPEPLSDYLPVVGRGQACWKVIFSRPGPPVHEVMRPLDEPSVIAAGAEFVARLGKVDARLAAEGTGPFGLRASAFIGQIHSGEIYNQYPSGCLLEGTRRWLPGTDRRDVESEFRALIDSVARDTGTSASLEYQLVRDAFHLDPESPLVAVFQGAYESITGKPLSLGAKPFVDDGNSFCSLGGIPAITHGPKAGGQHTVNEWVSIDDLVRVARVYALTASRYGR